MTEWLYITHPKTGERAAVTRADYARKHIGDTGKTYQELGWQPDGDVADNAEYEPPKARAADKPKDTDA